MPEAEVEATGGEAVTAASYNRGSRVIAREADERAAGLVGRVERQALADENARLRRQVDRLEHELARARRCLAAERFAREKRVEELKVELRSARFGIRCLCRLAARLGAPGFASEDS